MKKYKKIIFFLIIFLVAVMLGSKGREYIQNAISYRNQKNLIIISIDTLRQDSLGVYGYPKNTTPNIDSFAKQATVFENAYTQVPITYASFASLMTGDSPFESGVYNNVSSKNVSEPFTASGGLINGRMQLTENTQTLARILQNNNYATGAFVMNYTLEPELSHLNIGFDTYVMNIQRDARQRLHPDVTVNKSIKWIDEQGSGHKPLFLWIHFLDPHTPYIPFASTACSINKKFCSKDSEKQIQDIDQQRRDKQILACLRTPLDNTFVSLNKDLYDAEIVQTDKYVGQLLDKLKERGLYKNSIIVIYGDHGESFDHNFYFLHGQTLYDSTTKIPLIVYTPDSTKRGGKVMDFIKNTDIFTSLLSLLNVKSTSNTTKNTDFSNLLKNGSTSIDNNNAPIFFMSVNATKFAVRKGNYKYILSLENDKCKPQGSNNELYDLKIDPHEENNLVDKNKKISSELNAILIKYLSEHPIKSAKKETVNLFNKDVTQSGKRQEIIDQLKSLGY